MAISITGNVVDVFQRRVFPGEVLVEDGKIQSITPLDTDMLNGYILPGFIDAHVHIESSMLIPSEFARIAVTHGTVATISDPHEIANVCGMEGVDYMIENGKSVPFKFYFGVPSCVPATTFETAGAALRSDAVDELLSRDEIKYLSEMMNFPGVLQADEEVIKKIASAKRYGKPVDGHAPGLVGDDARRYIEAGMSTDHECFTKDEALDKLNYGMKILIREGSAAKNFDALISLLNDHPADMMFCSDDKHPDSLVEGHINQLCARAVAEGIDVFNVLQAACVNPVLHYRLDVGLLRVGDPADFIVVEDMREFKVIETYIDGLLVAQNGGSQIRNIAQHGEPVNNFECEPIMPDSLQYDSKSEKIQVIEALDGQLITNKVIVDRSTLSSGGQILTSNLDEDILKIVVVNRYHMAPPAIGFVKNFGFKEGAIASSVAHDSHNIIAVGVDDESLSKAINLVIEERGGVSVVGREEEMVLPLPVAGLMSDKDGYYVASQYTAIDAAAKKLGSKLSAPFMTLSFMALLVIPHLKMSDLGLFDGDEWKFVG
jgi:adenine deaminase